MTNAPAVPAGLRRLDPEPWGSRLTRAREISRFSPSQEVVARWISNQTGRPISAATISRLETRSSVPLDRGRRATSYLLSMLYELDPSELDLNPDDGPQDDLRTRMVAAVSSADISRYAAGNSDEYLVVVLIAA